MIFHTSKGKITESQSHLLQKLAFHGSPKESCFQLDPSLITRQYIYPLKLKPTLKREIENPRYSETALSDFPIDRQKSTLKNHCHLFTSSQSCLKPWHCVHVSVAFSIIPTKRFGQENNHASPEGKLQNWGWQRTQNRFASHASPLCN